MSRTDSRHWASCIASEQDVVVFPVERVGRGWLPSSEVTHRRRPFRLCVVLVGDAESEKRRVRAAEYPLERLLVKDVLECWSVLFVVHE